MEPQLTATALHDKQLECSTGSVANGCSHLAALFLRAGRSDIRNIFVPSATGKAEQESVRFLFLDVLFLFLLYD